ncbi:MAG TPA: anthranilate synthase component I [Pseudomonadales bacterium]|nr:anthranilate synthase component I [Pseudomonadales bacterium]
MTPERFTELAAQGFNRIPVTRTVLADLDTPLSSYVKLARGPYSYLFESVQGGEKWGRYSIIGLPCRTVMAARGNMVTVSLDGAITEQYEYQNPYHFVEKFKARYRVPDIEGLPRFHGGLVGYFGYDTVRYVEQRLAHSTPHDDIGNPDILLMVSEDVLVFDNLMGTISIICHANTDEPHALEQALARIDELAARLDEPSPHLPSLNLNGGDTGIVEADFTSQLGQQAFEAAVEKIRQYVLAGDAMQVVPSQRLSVHFSTDPIHLYRALRHLNPSPHMYFLDLDDFQIVGSSPEILARVEDDTVTIRPIAGTRPRGANPQQDAALEQELLQDPKEIAEHLMLIDLGRNDVGRVAQTGTVEVTENMVVERYSHVMHIVSNVQGKLDPSLSALDVLQASLPTGTLSGAPKIRAMEIIDEVETVKRGVYGGAVGYISWQGDTDNAIAIRTAVIKNNTLYVQAGAGVVADSVPTMEWQETMNKARAIMRAAALATRSA